MINRDDATSATSTEGTLSTSSGKVRTLSADEAPQVGFTYLVPTMRWVKHRPAMVPEIVPLLGPEHEDAEIVNFPHLHWHIDWRFVPKRAFALAYAHDLWRRTPWGRIHARVACSDVLDGDLVPRPMVCRRIALPYVEAAQVKWLPLLELAYSGANARCGVCPHRGIPLAGASIEANARVCPGHGLRWDIETGELVRR